VAWHWHGQAQPFSDNFVKPNAAFEGVFFGWVVFYRVGQPRKQCSGDIVWAWLPAGDSADEPAGVFCVCDNGCCRAHNHIYDIN
jgi:hypothetical protein